MKKGLIELKKQSLFDVVNAIEINNSKRVELEAEFLVLEAKRQKIKAELNHYADRVSHLNVSLASVQKRLVKSSVNIVEVRNRHEANEHVLRGIQGALVDLLGE